MTLADLRDARCTQLSKGIRFCPMARQQPALARREREIMDVVYRLGGATSRQIRDELLDPPHPAAVRTLLRILESKGQLRHVKDGPRHVYMPTTPRSVAQRSAVRHLLSTFFDGSRAAAVAALLDDGDQPLTSSERQALAGVVRKLRDEGR
jgi:predicted transcriptional regulator